MRRVCRQCAAEFDGDKDSPPFCSERCRLLDLGAWATEKYRIAASQPAPVGAVKNAEKEEE